jgi:hypothetical protein
MRFLVIVKATKESEAGQLPTAEQINEMGAFNEQLVKAGAMLLGEGLRPSSRGKRIHYAGGKPTVIDGPFAETKELVAGFWLLQLKSTEEAVEWLKRAPFEDADIEIRPLHEMEDFAGVLTPDETENLRRRSTPR